MLPGQQQQPPSSSVIDWPRVCLRLFGSVSHFFFFFFFPGECVAIRCRRRHFGNIPTIFSTVIASTAFHLVGVRTRSGGKKENKTKNNVKVEDIICDKRNESHTQTHTCLSLSPREWAKKKEAFKWISLCKFFVFPFNFLAYTTMCVHTQ